MRMRLNKEEESNKKEKTVRRESNRDQSRLAEIDFWKRSV